MRIFRELEPGGNTNSSIIEDEERICANLEMVRTVVGLGSARGGVGKSALAVNIAAALALAGRKVGIVDADLNSPSISAMLGMKIRRRSAVNELIEPGAGPLGIRVVGSNFIAQGEPPVSFLDPNELAMLPQNGVHPAELGYLTMLRCLLGRTMFGSLDLLLVDLASGVEAIYRLFKIFPQAGILLASHSSNLAGNATASAIALAAQTGRAVLGVVENMAGFSCDSCHMVRPLLPYGGTGPMVREAGVPLLERLPFDPRLAEACDRGMIFVREYPDTPLAKQLIALAQVVDKAAHHQTVAMANT